MEASCSHSSVRLFASLTYSRVVNTKEAPMRYKHSSTENRLVYLAKTQPHTATTQQEHDIHSVAVKNTNKHPPSLDILQAAEDMMRRLLCNTYCVLGAKGVCPSSTGMSRGR